VLGVTKEFFGVFAHDVAPQVEVGADGGREDA
jgi:hypothetical protein